MISLGIELFECLIIWLVNMGILGNISVNSKSVKIAIVALYKLIACHSGLVEFTRLLKSCKAKSSA